MQVLALPDGREEEGKAAAAAGTVAVGAFTLEQQVLVAGNDFYLVNGDTGDCGESRSRADSAAGAVAIVGIFKFIMDEKAYLAAGAVPVQRADLRRFVRYIIFVQRVGIDRAI